MRDVWNHNSHYRDAVLALIPQQAVHVLDVGCGFGFFATHLARHGRQVDAIDIDGNAIETARQLHAERLGLQFSQTDFLAADIPDDSYDVLTCIAALHHMPFAEGIAKMVRVLRPGGSLVVLGLYRTTTLGDYARAAVALPVSRGLRVWYDPHGEAAKQEPILRSPGMPLATIRKEAAALLPGVSLKRFLLWRYLLSWQKPDPGSAAS